MQAKIPGIVALVVAVLAVVNFIFAACGLPAIPVDESQITAVLTGVVGLIGVAGTMWHNFNATDASKVGQSIIDGIKDGSIDLGEAQKLITDAAEKATKVAEDK